MQKRNENNSSYKPNTGKKIKTGFPYTLMIGHLRGFEIVVFFLFFFLSLAALYIEVVKNKTPCPEYVDAACN